MGKIFHILILFGSLVVGAYTAQADSFTLPKEPLRISNTGFIMAPERMNYPTEYGTIFEDGRIKHLTNILLSKGEPLTARCEDGVYRPIHLNGNSGTVLITGKNGKAQELNRTETLADLRDYFLALNMDQDPSIQKFMARYFGQAGPGFSYPNQGPNQNPSRESHGTENPSKSGGRPTQTPPSDLGLSPQLEQTPEVKPLPQEESKVQLPQEKSKAEEQQDKISTQSFRNKRFYFWAIERESIVRQNGREFRQLYGSACGSSLVSRNETGQKTSQGEAVCKLAFLTAGHCIPTESEIKFNGDGQKPYTKNIKIRAPNGAEIETGNNFEVVFPPNYKGRRLFRGIDAQGKIISDEINENINSDYAMVFMDAPCSKTSPDEVSVLAQSVPKVQDRLTAIDQQNLPKPILRREKAPRATGQLAATLDQLGDIKPGDSGGPIFDKDNRLVGAISSVETPEGDKDARRAHSVTFDPNSPDWVRDQLRKRFPQPKVHQGEELECKDGVCKVPQRNDSAGREPLFPRLNNVLNRIADPLIPDRKTGGLQEVGPVPTRQLENVLEQARKNGFKHIVIRYGTDRTCKYCRELRDNLKRQFGKDSDVMVIKVEDSVPQAGEGIPQSDLLSLDGSGHWKKQIETRIGSGNTAQEFKSHVNQLKRSAPRNLTQEPQAPQQSRPQQQAPKQPTPPTEEDFEDRDFECVRSENGFRPRHKEFRKALGAGTISNLEDCKKAIKASRNGVICASTGLPGGFKPTYLRGVTPSRPDSGYVGGSSMSFEACLYATENSTSTHICYWGGSAWFATHPTGDRSSKGGPFNSLQNCVASYGGTPRVAQKKPPQTPPTPKVQQPPQVQQVPQTNQVPPPAQVPQTIPTDFSEVYPRLRARMGSGQSSPESIVIDDRYMTQLLGNAGQDKLKKEVVDSLNSFNGTKFKPENVELQLTLNSSGNSAISARRKGTDQLIGEVELTPQGKLNEVKSQTRGLTQIAPETPQTPTETPPPAPEAHNAPPSALKAHELINQNCLNCHSGGNARKFPEWMTQPGELERRLGSSNASEKAQARAMIQQLYNVLVEDDNMPPKSAVEQRKAFLENPETEKFKAWVAQEHAKLNGHNADRTSSHTDSSQPPRATASVARNSVQTLPPAKLAAYRAMLPKVENSELEAILRDPNTIFFDRQSMVPGYQDPSTPVSGVRTTELGFRGAAFGAGAENLYLDKEGHLRTFSHGVGLDTAGNTGTFHFIHLPKDANGNLQKIKVLKRIVPPEQTPTYDWVFPVGTVSGEVVFNKDASGKPQVLEIRTRKKDNAQGAWAPDIMRPFPTAGTLKEKLTEIVANNPSLKGEAQGLLQHLNNPQRLKPLDLKLNGYQKGNFTSKGGTDVLPNMSESMVQELLKTPFKSSLGAEWDRNGNVVAFAPTTNQANGLIPQHGTTGAIRVDRQSCNKCHEESNKPIYNFFNKNHPLFTQSILAYGNLPGSDRNLRFTIFDQRYYKDFGNDGKGDNRRINPQLLPILDMQ